MWNRCAIQIWLTLFQHCEEQLFVDGGGIDGSLTEIFFGKD